MKLTVSLAILCIALAITLPKPACAQQTKEQLSTSTDIVRDWQFDQDALAILKAALLQQRTADTSAIHLVNQDITANMIYRVWHFTWQKQRLKISESSFYIAAVQADAQVTILSASYTVSANNGALVCEWSHKDYSGRTKSALVKPSKNGIVVDIVDSENGRSQKSFASVEAPYREVFRGATASALSAGQKDAINSYDIDSAELRKSDYAVEAVNRKPLGNPPWIAKMSSSTGSRAKCTAYMDAMNHIVKLSMGAMEFVKCKPTVAIRERSTKPKGSSISTPNGGLRLTQGAAISSRWNMESPTDLSTRLLRRDDWLWNVNPHSSYLR